MDYGVVRNTDGTLILSSGNSPQMVRGMDALVQTVLIELCSKPLPPQGGSGFVAGMLESTVGDTEAAQDMSLRLRNAKQNILAYQRDANLPQDERLSDLRLLSVRPQGMGWAVDIRVTNVSGEEQIISPG